MTTDDIETIKKELHDCVEIELPYKFENSEVSPSHRQ